MSKKKKTMPLPRLAPGLSLVDTHCHLDFTDYSEDFDEVLGRAHEAGVRTVISVGIDLATSRRAIAIAERHGNIFAAVGVHPHHVEGLSAADYKELRELGRHPKVVAYGEIGLDYVKKYAPVRIQQEHFNNQVRLAKELGLPLIVHDREAHADVLALLEAARPFPAKGVMHCFSGDADFAGKVLALDWYISIPGVVTFNKAEVMQEAVRRLPLEALLLETDGPFLAPAPKRGKRNEPAFLPYTAQKVADLKGVSLDEVAKKTTDNAGKLFRLGE